MFYKNKSELIFVTVKLTELTELMLYKNKSELAHLGHI